MLSIEEISLQESLKHVNNEIALKEQQLLSLQEQKKAILKKQRELKNNVQD